MDFPFGLYTRKSSPDIFDLYVVGYLHPLILETYIFIVHIRANFPGSGRWTDYDIDQTGGK